MTIAEEIYHRFVRYEWEEISDTMKKSILEAINEALNIECVSGSDFLDVKKAQEQFSIACKKYIESKPHQDMIKALKRVGAF